MPSAGAESSSGLSRALMPAAFPSSDLVGATSAYPSTPAPMGLADLGRGPNGTYAYTSASFAANVSLTSFSAYSPGEAAWLQAPNWATISLDTVAVGLPINGSLSPTADGTFWVENAVRFNGTVVQFEDNIWNFSAASSIISPGTFLSGAPLEASPLGSGTFYQRWGPTYPVAFPMTLDLVNTLGVVDGRPVLFFNFSLGSAAAVAHGTYDAVTFNASLPGRATPAFEVNGSGLNPYGLRDDAELVFGGDGAGSNANIDQINGTTQLYFQQGAGYRSVPSAYDYGEDAGGTSAGIGAYFVGSSEHLDAGPSFLYGLWNTSASSLGPAATSGWIQVPIELTPGFGVLMATNLTANEESAGSNFSFVPTSANGTATLDLPPPPAGDPYVFAGWADGFDSAQVSASGNGSGPILLNLPADPDSWTAPLRLEGAGQLMSRGIAGGTGVTYDPATDALTIVDHAIALAAPFRQLNDYDVPLFTVFSARDLSGGTITLSAVSEAPSSFAMTVYGTPVDLPGVSEQYTLANVTGASTVENLSLVGPAAVTGTYGALAPAPAVEMYGAQGARAFNISANNTTGVFVVNSTDTHVADLQAINSGTGVEFYDALGGTASGLSAVPSPSGSGGAVAVRVLDSDHVVIDGVDVQMQDVGVVANDSQNLSVEELTLSGGRPGVVPEATSGGIGIEGTILAHVTLVNWNDSCPTGPSGTQGFAEYNTTCNMAGWIDRGSDLTVTNLSSSNSTGLSVMNWTGITAQNLRTAGNFTEALTMVNDCSDATISNVTAIQGSDALYFLYFDHNFTFTNLTATGGGNDVAVLADSSDARFANINVSDQSGGAEGTFNSTDLAFSNVSASTSAEGVGGTDLSNVSLSGGTAYDEGLVLLLLESANVTARGVRALNGSIGISLSDTDNASVSGLFARDRSVALSWWTGTGGSVSNLTASDVATDAQLAGLSDTTVFNLNETNAKLGPAYFYNNFTGIYYPDGPLQTYTDPGLVVTNITAVNCSFALQDVYSPDLQISDIRSWDGGTAVQLNGTEYSSVEDVFSASDVRGLQLVFVLNVTVTGSTFEDSSSNGVFLTDARNVTIYGNNFVANDGASALGVYNPAHVQAAFYLVQGTNFTWDGIGNYWSDWSSRAPYPVGADVNDTAPAPAFLHSWLAFVANGLAPGARWTVSVATHAYTATAPRVVIPAWVLPTGTVRFGAVPPPGWAVSPRAGTVVFRGQNESVNLTFTLPSYAVHFAASGLPAGTVWTATLAGMRASNRTRGGSGEIAFTEPNGTYGESVGAQPGFFEGTVGPGSQLTVDGANVTVAVPFVRFTYPLTLAVAGLPAGTVWGATVNGTFERTNASSLGWDEPNGSFAYNLTAIPGWHESSIPYHGTVTLANRSIVLTTVWFREHYAVQFVESGLPNGTPWTIVFGGQNLTTNGTSVSFATFNGTYAFRDYATLPTVFGGTPPNGNVSVNGNGSTVTVSFSVPVAYPHASGPNPLTLYLAFVAVAGAAVVASLALTLRRRQEPPEERELDGADLPVPPRAPRGPAAPEGSGTSRQTTYPDPNSARRAVRERTNARHPIHGGGTSGRPRDRRSTGRGVPLGGPPPTHRPAREGPRPPRRHSCPVPPHRPPRIHLRGRGRRDRLGCPRAVLRSVGGGEDQPREGPLESLPEGRVGRRRVPRPRPPAQHDRPGHGRPVPPVSDLFPAVRPGRRCLPVRPRSRRPGQSARAVHPVAGGVRVCAIAGQLRGISRPPDGQHQPPEARGDRRPDEPARARTGQAAAGEPRLPPGR
jgi:nitrous oxidase accessory protein NosD